MLTPRVLVFYRALFFCLYGTIGILFPFFVLYLRGGVGLSDKNIALLSSLSGITIILFQQGWGYIADVLVPKKKLLVINMLGSGLLFMIVYLLSKSWTLAIAIFFYNSVYTSVNQLLHGFLFAHPGSERHFGLLRAWGSLGFVVANLGVGYVSDNFAGGNLGFIFPLFLLMMLVSVLLILPLPEYPTKHEDPPDFWSVQRHFLCRPQVAFFLLMSFIYQAAHTPTYSMQSLLMADMGADRSTIAFSYSLAAVLELPVFFAAGALISRFGAPKLMLMCAVIQTARWVLVWAATTPEQVIVISLSHCLTFGLFYAAAVTYMNGHAGPHLKASAQTLFAMVYQGMAGVLGMIVGGLTLSGGMLAPATRFLTTRVFGLADHGDLANLYLGGAAVAGVATFLAVGLIVVERRCGTGVAEP